MGHVVCVYGPSATNLVVHVCMGYQPAVWWWEEEPRVGFTGADQRS